MPAAGSPTSVAPVDAFELPAWIGEETVTWVAEDSLGAGHLVHGTLHGPTETTVCDVLAGDHAYPSAALDDVLRRDMHQTWSLGQVLLLAYDERLTLAAPGRVVDADLALESVRRFAKAVGAPPRRFSVTLRL
ncbi:hypothetical protein G7072_08820 [Nocardioides sp. HDW12B]|uniref:hypothetical protein n=1 Tax=Nocardioides sp. HDW12B TaxID=2714939 RepID=UPI00140DDC34|nr:hypothetical protein [Nocardioides sp. HDW12B]QIK66442.1 hypothetical protein G7072_08820 [Nocardioides sp. HDW12B]